jgi:sugar fermentation stimulation protein A
MKLETIRSLDKEKTHEVTDEGLFVFHFEQPLQQAIFERRYKRFLADVTLGGQCITIHCPNTGKMRGLCHTGSRVLVSHHLGSGRKYPYTLEAFYTEGTLVGANTYLPNRIMAQALAQRWLPPFQGYSHIRPEAPYGERSRIDFLLSGREGIPPCYIEVKNVHYKEGTQALFPDSPTVRGQKHLRELIQKAGSGHRCCLVYIVQRDDCETFSFSKTYDPDYAALAEESRKVGVEHYAYSFSLSPQRAVFHKELDVIW